MEINTMGLLKQGPDVDREALTNIERFRVAGALVEPVSGRGSVRVDGPDARLSLPPFVPLGHTSDESATARVDGVRVSEGNRRAYGYRCLHDALNASGEKACEWLVRLLTNGLGVHFGTLRKLSNLPGRDFHSAVPGVKPLTDITEFAFADDKLCPLSIIDRYDGRILAYMIGERFKAVLPKDAGSTIHSAQGCRYWRPGRIWRMRWEWSIGARVALRTFPCARGSSAA